ncbi:MAG: hypothetical protein AAFP08_14970, partial [Bacteroidota bacterium]
ANGMHKQAEQYGSIFLAAYPKEVARHRWHLFYSVYFEALLECGQAEKLIKTARKYKLTERENELQTGKYRVPMLGAYYTIAQYQEGMICLEEMRDKLQKIGLSAIGDQLQENKWSTKTKKLIRWVPQLAGDLMHWGYKPVESAAF